MPDAPTLPVADFPVDPTESLALTQDLQRAGLSSRTPGDLLLRVIDRLAEAGIHLIRANLSQLTIHPLVRGYDFDWWEGQGLHSQSFDAIAPSLDPSALRKFPFYVMQTENIDRLRRRLDQPADLWFPIFDRLQEHGATDYFARIYHFEEDEAARGPLGAFNTSWATDRPGGFRDRDLALIDLALNAVAPCMRYLMLSQVVFSVSEIYLGQDAGQRVLMGEIQRGSLRTLRAAILYADMQGSTRIADDMNPRGFVDLLNEYFEGAVDAIHAAGGQVLKFMGDGLLAIFTAPEPGADEGASIATAMIDKLLHRREEPIDPVISAPDPEKDRDVTNAVLRAVDGLRAAEDAITQGRIADGQPITRFSVAVHLGEVMYGNIGGRDRLDFTVVGPAVNEASRLLAMARPLERDVVVSSAVVEATDCPARGRLVNLGRYMLRGVSQPRTLYTLLPPPK